MFCRPNTRRTLTISWEIRVQWASSACWDCGGDNYSAGTLTGTTSDFVMSHGLTTPMSRRCYTNCPHILIHNPANPDYKKTQMCLFRARICAMHQRMWRSRCQQHKEAEFQNLSLLSRPSYLNSRRRKYLKSIWWLEKRSLNITKVTTGIRSYYRWRETMQDGLPWGLEGCLDSKQWVQLLQGVWRSVCMSGCNFSTKGSDTLF